MKATQQYLEIRAIALKLCDLLDFHILTEDAKQLKEHLQTLCSFDSLESARFARRSGLGSGSNFYQSLDFMLRLVSENYLQELDDAGDIESAALDIFELANMERIHSLSVIKNHAQQGTGVRRKIEWEKEEIEHQKLKCVDADKGDSNEW